MLEFFPFSLLSVLYNIVKDFTKWILGRQKKLTPKEKIDLRQKWKQQFEKEILKNFNEDLRQDVIIRDVSRVDNYPDADDGKKISSWFRLGLIDIYHRGILVAFQWEELVKGENGQWRIKNHKIDDSEGSKAVLAAKIPFENIENVDFDGDEYYNFPHIYCHFSIKGTPYEAVSYYVEKQNPGGRPFYTEVASQKDVLARSKHLRRRRFRWFRAG